MKKQPKAKGMESEASNGTCLDILVAARQAGRAFSSKLDVSPHTNELLHLHTQYLFTKNVYTQYAP